MEISLFILFAGKGKHSIFQSSVNPMLFMKYMIIFLLPSLSGLLNLEAGSLYEEREGTDQMKCYTIYTHIDIDYDFYVRSKKSKAVLDEEVRKTMAKVSAFYSEKFDVTFEVGVVKIYDRSQDDPYYSIVDDAGGAFLTKMKQIHHTTITSAWRELYILYTDNVIKYAGLANSGGLYGADNAYCLVNGSFDETATAHEIGHLLGVTHCDAACASVDSYPHS